MHNLSELQSMVGQTVRKSWFNNTLGIHIIIKDAYRTEDGDTEGILGFVGTEITEDAAKIFKPGASICPIWNEPGDIYGIVADYDE